MAFERFEAKTEAAAEVLRRLESAHCSYECVEGGGFAAYRGDSKAFFAARNRAETAYRAVLAEAQALADAGDIVERVAA